MIPEGGIFITSVNRLFMVHSYRLCQNNGMKTLNGYLLRLLPSTLALLLAGSLLLALAPQLAGADDDWRKLYEDVQAGRVKPLADILDRLAQEWVGQVVDVDYDLEGDRRIYGVELLGDEGQIVEFEVDAVTGELIGIEGSDIDAMKRKQ